MEQELEQEQKQKKPLKERVSEFLAGAGIAGSGVLLKNQQKNVNQLYRDYLYPALKTSDPSKAIISSPQTKKINSPYTVTLGKNNPPILAQDITNPVLINYAYTAAKLYPKVDKTSQVQFATALERAGGFAATRRNKNTGNVEQVLVGLGPTADLFTAAHELGHASAQMQNSTTLGGKIHNLYESQNRDFNRASRNKASVYGAALGGLYSDSLPQAIGAGILSGVSLNASLLGSEITATKRGLNIMKKAGTTPTYGKGLAQVGNYLVGTTLAPVASSVAAYGLKKATKALFSKAESKKKNNQDQQNQILY